MPRIQLRLKNETDWDTTDLRRIVLAGLREFADPLGWPGRWNVTVQPLSNQSYYNLIHGRARYHSRRVWLWLVSPDKLPERARLETNEQATAWDRMTALLVGYIARVLEHELLHNHGVTHKEMKRDGYSCWRGPVPEWAKGLTLRRKAKKQKAQPTREEKNTQKEAHALAKLKEWEGRTKRAQNKVRHWRRKVRYFQRRAAALKDER